MYSLVMFVFLVTFYVPRRNQYTSDSSPYGSLIKPFQPAWMFIPRDSKASIYGIFTTAIVITQ